MNSNRRVLHLVLYSTGLFLLTSVLAIFFDLSWHPFDRVNLVSDVLKPSRNKLPGKQDQPSDSSDIPVIVDAKPAEDFNLYYKAATINSFYTDSSRIAVDRFIYKLQALKGGKPVKIRIAYFGDSMIEGDLLTQTLRQLLQKQFGGSGVGFVPVTSPVSKFRQTVSATYSQTWSDENFKDSKTSRLYLSGHSFHTDNGWVQMVDQTSYDSTATVEKSLIYGASAGKAIRVNGQAVTLPGTGPVNRTVLAANNARSVRVDVADNDLPIFGISFESSSGVFVDNFSFRGITGVEFAKIDSAFLRAIGQENPYDLIVFQYGVNLLFRPNDKNFSWYARTMLPIIRKIRGAFPTTDFILVSTADRAFRYDGQYKSAVGIDSLVKVQAALAYQTGSAFYNQFRTMGGTNSIVDWARQKPSLANQDYVHPNHRGAEILGNYFYEAIMKEYNKLNSAGAKAR